jgi:hypothetical protein
VEVRCWSANDDKAFEAGATALGKPVWGYRSRGGTLRQRVEAAPADRAFCSCRHFPAFFTYANLLTIALNIVPDDQFFSGRDVGSA